MQKEFSSAQYCINGHTIITNMSHPNLKSDFCSKCGAKTITECPKCQSFIPGDMHVVGYIYSNRQDRYYPRKRPSFCPNCGTPYPWTEKAIANLKSSLEDIKVLSKEEREQIISDCPDIFSETDATPIAAKRFKKAMSCAGKLTADFLVGFASSFGCTLFTKLLGI